MPSRQHQAQFITKMFGVFVQSANSPNIFMCILLRRRAGQSRRPYELIYALILVLQQAHFKHDQQQQMRKPKKLLRQMLARHIFVHIRSLLTPLRYCVE